MAGSFQTNNLGTPTSKALVMAWQAMLATRPYLSPAYPYASPKAVITSRWQDNPERAGGWQEKDQGRQPVTYGPYHQASLILHHSPEEKLFYRCSNQQQGLPDDDLIGPGV